MESGSTKYTEFYSLVTVNVGDASMTYFPSDYIGKFDDQGGRVLAVLVCKGGEVVLVVRARTGVISRQPMQWITLHDTDPTATEKV